VLAVLERTKRRPIRSFRSTCCFYCFSAAPARPPTAIAPSSAAPAATTTTADATTTAAPFPAAATRHFCLSSSCYCGGSGCGDLHDPA
jgi:hypothetical protein